MGIKFSPCPGCGCSSGLSCSPCVIPKSDRTLTIVAVGGGGLVCNPSSQTVTLVFNGTSLWAGTITYPSVLPFSPGTIYFTLGCLSGNVTLSWGLDPSIPFCGLDASNASSFTCSPFMFEWLAPIPSIGPVGSLYICGCGFESLTLT